MSGAAIERIRDGTDGTVHPPYLHPDYRSTRLRAPLRPLIMLPESMHDPSGPVYGDGPLAETDSDLTRQHAGEPLGERIIVTGRVLDGSGKPVPGALIELWQANAAGRYIHERDQHPAPLDPNFTGAGRCLTDERRHATGSRRSSPAPTRGRTTPTRGGRPTSTSRSSGARSPTAWSPRCTSRAIRSSRPTRSSSRSATRGLASG